MGFYYLDSQQKNSFSESNNNSTAFICSLSPAIYVVKGLSIEPEIGLMVADDADPGIFLLGNVSYTYFIPEKSFAPYAKVGFGVTNSMFAIPNVNVFSKTSKDLDITVLNLAAGLKILINKTAVIKTELNYRKLNYSEESGLAKYDFTLNYLSILIGMSFVIN